jgi:hypothetical protein
MEGKLLSNAFTRRTFRLFLTKIRGIIEKNKSATAGESDRSTQSLSYGDGRTIIDTVLLNMRIAAAWTLRSGVNCGGGAIADIRGRTPYG